MKRPVLFVLGLAAMFAVALGCAFSAPAKAATPTIVNQSSTDGQTNWLESFAAADDTGNQSQRLWVTLTVKHDPGREVTGIRIDDDYNGTDNASTATLRAVTAQQPTVVNGYDYSRISYNYLAPTSNTGLSCNVITGGTVTSTTPLRIRAQLDDGAQTATSSSNLKWARTDCTSRDDMPRVWGRSQTATSINVGDTVTFSFTADDSDSGLTTNQEFGGIRWRMRRLSDGATTSPAVVCYGGSDNTQRSLNTSFPRRGHWVVEAELLNSNNSCGTNPYSGAWYYLGAVDVNSPAASSPTLTLNATRPQIGGNTTVTATFGDPSDNGEGGRVQDIEWDLDQNTGNGVGGFEAIQLGDAGAGISSPQSKTISTLGMTPGAKTVRARVTDNGAMSGADNIRRTKTVSTTFLVDTPPVALPDDHRTVAGQALNFALAGTDVDNDTLTYTIVTPPQHGTLTGSGANRVYTPDTGFAGTDSLEFKVDDGFGGTSTAQVGIRTDPDILGFAGPSGTRDSRGGAIQFDSSVPGATFECAVDSEDWAACTSPWSRSDLPDGDHQMRVRVSANGLTNPDAATADWAIDAFPKIHVGARPSAISNSSGAAVEFTTDEDGATAPPTTECKLDDHAWSPCSSPISFDDLDDGDHEIQIRATDAYGKQSVESIAWTVVTAGSGVRIDAPYMPAITRSNAAEIHFSSLNPDATFECALDDGAWNACSNPLSLTGLPDGEHRVRVRSVFEGAYDATPAQVVWTVDGRAPKISITFGPDGAIPAGPTAFEFSADEPFVALECSVDGGPYAACASPLRLNDLADGPHSFRVAGTDLAGNRSNAEQRDFRVLSVAPPADFTAGPAQGATVTSDGVTFGFESTPVAAGYECRLDDGDWAPCTSPVSITALTDGAHTLSIRAVDEVGNRSAEATSRAFTVDTTAPRTTLTAGPSGTVRSASAEFKFTADESSTFECSVDGAGWEACVSPAAFEGLSDGSHQFRVRATDPAGNVEAPPVARTWRIDTSTTPPPDPPEEPENPAPCTLVSTQTYCDSPYAIAAVRAPYRSWAGKAKLSLELDSGGASLDEIRTVLPPGVRALFKRSGGRQSVGTLLLGGEGKQRLPLRFEPAAGRTHELLGGEGQPSVSLRARSVVISSLPAGVTTAKLMLKRTGALRFRTQLCGTRLWRSVLIDDESNRKDVNARTDVICVGKGVKR